MVKHTHTVNDKTAVKIFSSTEHIYQHFCEDWGTLLQYSILLGGENKAKQNKQTKLEL